VKQRVAKKLRQLASKLDPPNPHSDIFTSNLRVVLAEERLTAALREHQNMFKQLRTG
jgi:hypothetical protein